MSADWRSPSSKTRINMPKNNNWIHIWIINGGFSFYEVLRPLVLVVTPGHLCSRKSADGHLAKPFLSFQLLSRDSTIHMGKAIHRIQLGYWKSCQNKINLLFNMYLQKKYAKEISWLSPYLLEHDSDRSFELNVICSESFISSEF